MNTLQSSLLIAIDINVDNIVNALIYSFIGLILFALFWGIVIWVSPFSIRNEIEDDHNTPLGIILRAMIIGIAMIIAAAVGG